MKKIKKVKIVEVGRICSADELKQICGGSGYGGEDYSGACTFQDVINITIAVGFHMKPVHR